MFNYMKRAILNFIEVKSTSLIGAFHVTIKEILINT